ncbi:MAG: sugar phosphate isomerase/epimerase family protein [Verrucomicrobiales bacterium]
MQKNSRRQFLMVSSALAVGAAFSNFLTLGAAEKSATPRKIRKAIMYGTVGVPGSVMEKFQAIKAAGFEGVEAMSHLKQDEVLKAREATGLEIPSVCGAKHWELPLSHGDASVRARGVEALRQTLRDAKAYGASSVLLVPGVVTKEINYADAYTRSQEEIRKVLPLAEELKVRIAIENVWNEFLLSPLEAARYVDEFQSPWVAWHFDIGNIITFGHPEHWIKILGKKRIAQLHIKEFSREKRDKEGLWKGFNVEFMKGTNDWSSIMKALDEIGYEGWGIAEQGGASSPEGLRKLAAEMDKMFSS